MQTRVDYLKQPTAKSPTLTVLKWQANEEEGYLIAEVIQIQHLLYFRTGMDPGQPKIMVVEQAASTILVATLGALASSSLA